MERLFSAIFLFILFIIISLPTNAAAANIELKIDGVVISSDVKAEVKNSRTMVPLRIISENLGANVEWSAPTITLTKGDMQVKLNVRSNAVSKNGETSLLDVKPYLNNNRTMVPLRFISETFGCKVNYKNATVSVDCEPFVLDGVKVTALQHEYHMTMGGIIQQSRGNAYNEAVYQMFVKNMGSKVEAPVHYMWSPHGIDIPGSYLKSGQYDFLDKEGNSIKQFDVYYLYQSFPIELLEGYPKWLIHDVTKDHWYIFNETAGNNLYNFIYQGHFEIISNTLP